jgi:hypothetical protein
MLQGRKSLLFMLLIGVFSNALLFAHSDEVKRLDQVVRKELLPGMQTELEEVSYGQKAPRNFIPGGRLERLMGNQFEKNIVGIVSFMDVLEKNKAKAGCSLILKKLCEMYYYMFREFLAKSPGLSEDEKKSALRVVYKLYHQEGEKSLEIRLLLSRSILNIVAASSRVKDPDLFKERLYGIVDQLKENLIAGGNSIASDVGREDVLGFLDAIVGSFDEGRQEVLDTEEGQKSLGAEFVDLLKHSFVAKTMVFIIALAAIWGTYEFSSGWSSNRAAVSKLKADQQAQTQKFQQQREAFELKLKSLESQKGDPRVELATAIGKGFAHTCTAVGKGVAHGCAAYYAPWTYVVGLGIKAMSRDAIIGCRDALHTVEKGFGRVDQIVGRVENVVQSCVDTVDKGVNGVAHGGVWGLIFGHCR